MDELVRNAATIYMLTYFGLIVGVSFLEYVIPRREAGDTLRSRWLGNISVGIIGTTLVRRLFPAFGFGLAVLWDQRGWGLLRRLDTPFWLGTIVTLVALDAVRF